MYSSLDIVIGGIIKCKDTEITKVFNIVPKNKNPSYRSIKIELNLHCFGERLSSFIFEVKNILEILEIRSLTKKRNYLRVCSFWNSISVDFSSEQKCSSWQKLIICVVFRTTSAFLAELSMHACTATRHFIQLWGERVKVGRLIKARVFELGDRSNSFNGTKVISKTVGKTDSNYRLMNAGQGRIYAFPGPKRDILFLFIHK